MKYKHNKILQKKWNAKGIFIFLRKYRESILTWMFICHSKCISVKRYTSTSSFRVWRIHTKKKWPSWRQSTCKQFWTSSSDIDDELMVLSTKHFHVKLLSQARTISFDTINLETFLSLVWQSAITWSIRWTYFIDILFLYYLLCYNNVNEDKSIICMRDPIFFQFELI